MSTNALQSLYGGKVAAERALAGNVGGQKREQTVLTPKWFLSGLVAVAGLPLRLDPCADPTNHVGAKYYYTGDPDDGLAADWAIGGLVYVNPPYADLARWLAKCAFEGKRGALIYALIPFRPHRHWFCQHLSGVPIISLAPFPFVGQKQAFPAPLCVAVWNLPVPRELNMAMSKGRLKNLVTAEIKLTHQK